MHNGQTAYPGAVECINHLAQAGKKIVSGFASTGAVSILLIGLDELPRSMTER